jgi:hypothetical protein
MSRRWRRLASGQQYWQLRDGSHFLIDRGFGDEPGTDRRRQSWTLARVRPEPATGEMIADLLTTTTTAREAKHQAEKMESER